MDVQYTVEGNKIITNGDVIPLETFADKYDKIFMHIKNKMVLRKYVTPALNLEE